MAVLTKLFREFINSERNAGYILLFATVVSLLLTNVIIGTPFIDLLNQKAGFKSINLQLSVTHWINDGLMTIFFFMVGLEIERELYIGELSGLQKASLPIAAAVGGMLLPFAIHFLLNNGSSTQAGFGIPMATDIAFALGALSLVKNVPHSLKVFLTAFAIIDDLGAIIIIAIFYSHDFRMIYLLLALGVFAVLLILNRLKVYKLLPYVLLGAVMWYLMLRSGVHATISGVLLAFALPFGNGDENSPSYKMQHFLHKPVAFLILPIFALANTAILLSGFQFSTFITSNTVGIIAGLLIGKPTGILLFSFIAISLGLCKLPPDLSWRKLLAAAILGGIGFTMSIFITLLAFSDGELIFQSKIAILLSSLVAAATGIIVLRYPKK